MTTTKLTKHAFLASVLSLILCLTMLVGTTFAWFTDDVTSANNVITAGNLDIELEYWDGDVWKDVKDSTELFDKNALWEPGFTQIVYLKTANAGSLALRYALGVRVTDETEGRNTAGEVFKLSDYIYYDVIEDVNPETDAWETREEAMAYATESSLISQGFAKSGTLQAGDAPVYLAMIVYMPTTVGNAANYATGTEAPEITLGVNVVATQYTAEEDSFGRDYDKDALVCDVIATPETVAEILAGATEGLTVGLSKGVYGDIVIPVDHLTLVSNEAVVNFVDLNGKNGTTLDGLTFDAAGAKDPSNIAGSVAASIADNSVKTGSGASVGADNTVITNCTFMGTAPASYAAILFYEQGRSDQRANNLTVTHCNFVCRAGYYMCIDYMDPGEILIANNTFGTPDNAVNMNYALKAGSNKSDIRFENNTVYNFNPAAQAIYVTPGTVDFTVYVGENRFVQPDTASEYMVFALKQNAGRQLRVLFEGNVANDGLYAVDEEGVLLDGHLCFYARANGGTDSQGGSGN